MPPEDNRGIDNLLLLCIEHSYEIDETPGQFPADTLREWKAAQIAEYDHLQRSWPINDDEATEILVASESFGALHAPSTIELVRRVEALRLTAERTRGGPRSWSRGWQQLNERVRRSFVAYDDDGDPVYLQPSAMELRPIQEGLRSALATAHDEVRSIAEAAQIELAAVRVTRTQVAPWCDALERAMTEVIAAASNWLGGADPESDIAFEAALADLKRSVDDLVRASRGEQVEVPEPPEVISYHSDVDPFAEHRELLDQARPFARVSHRPYDLDLRDRVAEATGFAASVPLTPHLLPYNLDGTARLAVAVASNASEEQQLELVRGDRQRLPTCAAVALLLATANHGDGRSAAARAATEQLRLLWSEIDWANPDAWAANDVNGQSMMYTFAYVTSVEEVRDRLAKALEANPDLLRPLVISCASWVELIDHQTWRPVRFERTYGDLPPWLPMEAIKTLAIEVLVEDAGLDDSKVMAALLRKFDQRS
ncbi:hypothetical protein [Mycolicibacterium anyangense]|nr:hypothetical protein [Mycolicibacterium anyangense]